MVDYCLFCRVSNRLRVDNGGAVAEACRVTLRRIDMGLTHEAETPTLAA
jgi:hypothetical protein